jgi:mono/diheme cytochrome c family protein
LKRLIPPLAAASLILSLGTVLAAAVTHWEAVPPRDHARQNPFAGDTKAIAAGAILYHDHCEKCHQVGAQGDGGKKPSLRTSSVKGATDGDLEWFLRQGDIRHGMPPWSNLPQAQRWQVIDYLRSLP